MGVRSHSWGTRDAMSLPRSCSTALAVIGCALNSAMAQQKITVEVGVLACNFSESSRDVTGRAGAELQAGNILCSFKLKSGAEETYTGRLRGVSVPAEHKGTLLWVVKIPSSATPSAPGLLQQRYVADAKAAADQIPDVIGEMNPDIVLQSMAERSEGRTHAPEKLLADDFVILEVELKLKSTAG